MADPRIDTQQHEQPGGWLLQDVSNAMVALHQEQFGRGPAKAQSHLAGADALVCVMEDALLPAERKMVDMGEQQRVRESRMFFQVATADHATAPSIPRPRRPSGVLRVGHARLKPAQCGRATGAEMPA